MEMVDPVAAGVVFTVNPATSSGREMVAEAVWGLGEGLVSGSITPQSLVLDAMDGTITTDLSGPHWRQSKKLICGPQTPQPEKRVIQVDVEESEGGENGSSGPLGKESIRRALVNAGRAMSEAYGPLDIEFAIDSNGNIALVQARAITSLAFPRTTRVATLVQADRSAPVDEDCSVTGFARFALLLAQHSSWFDPVDNMVLPSDPSEIVQFAFGRGYLCKPYMDPYWGLEDDVTPDELAVFATWTQKVEALENAYAAQQQRSNAIVRFAHDSFVLQVDQNQSHDQRVISSTLGPPPPSSSPHSPHSPWPEETMDLVDLVLDLMEMYTQACSLSWLMGFVSSLHQQDAKAKLDSLDLAGEEPIRLSSLVTNVHQRHHATAKAPMMELSGLVEDVVSQGPDLKATILSIYDSLTHSSSDAGLGGESEEEEEEEEEEKVWTLTRALLADERTAEVGEALSTYFQTFFYMADEDWDSCSVHWVEDPSFVEGVFVQLLRQREWEAPVLTRGETAANLYNSEMSRLEAILNSSPSSSKEDDAASETVLQAVALLRKSAAFKERIHVTYVKIGFEMKMALHQLRDRFQHGRGRGGGGGGRGSSSGYERDGLGGGLEGDAVYAVLPDSLRAFSEGRCGWEDVVLGAQTRHYEHKLWSHLADVPDPIGHGVVVDQADLEVKGEDGGAGGASGGGVSEAELEELRSACSVMHGLPISPGKSGRPVGGVVRVAKSLADTRGLQRGEILVAESTSPAWTPLFQMIGGLVLVEGGMLSHGAVVAREFGIPAVAGVWRAMEVFRTGDRVVVDGEEGVVMRVGDDVVDDVEG